MRSAKVMANAFEAGFQRIVHRFWPVPVGSNDRVTEYRHGWEMTAHPHRTPVAGVHRFDRIRRIHGVFGAEIGAFSTSEVELSGERIGLLQPGMLVVADRGLYGFGL